LSQVIDVVEMNRVYAFDNLKTNKGLKLKYGTDERVFRIEFVSNAEFGQEEFADWKTVTKEECGSLPTMDHIEKKEQDIKKAMNFNYTDEVIEYIVNEKKKFSDKVKNFAVTKGELMKKKSGTDHPPSTRATFCCVSHASSFLGTLVNSCFCERESQKRFRKTCLFQWFCLPI
ncbi:hypothetical protein ANCDUO_08093, partial [Ancylostoma duodenale]